MIPILRVLVLTMFAALAFVLACGKKQHHMTYRLILTFVAVGATTFLPEEAILLQVIAGFAVFFLLSALLQIAVRICFSEKSSEEKKVRKV